MSRSICLALVLVGLVAAPGCNSCSGGMRRPSFMEFRSPCGREADPCGAPACQPACGPAPCCSEGPAMSGPSGAPMIVEQGTFS